MKSGQPFNEICHADCIDAISALPEGCVDLAFADPPFNIGYEYDVYHDKKDRQHYLDWSKRWIKAVHRVLKPSGTFWLAIGDDYAAELKLASQEIGFHPRSWVIWYYTFGVNCKHKFSRSHVHLFYFVKDPKKFTFRSAELENRIPSARQLVYGDSRANPDGRLPDDTWVLRPQDLADCFTPEEDTWYFPRVAGTFKERAGFHGCQMPEQLLGRIIRSCSDEGELVLDPFSGSATTVAVAKKLGRRYLAFDLSAEYVLRGNSRLESIRVGDPLDGAAEPTMSAPATPKTGKRRAAQRAIKPDEAPSQAPAQTRMLHDGLLEAFRQTHDGFSLDRVVADPQLNQRLADACRQLGLPGEARTWNWVLFGMRKAGLLVDTPTTRRTEFSWTDCEEYLFASEIAWRQMIDAGSESLDSILCDPFLAAEFDAIAKRWAPGYSELEYRWAAMRLRKKAKEVRGRAEVLTDAHLSKAFSLESIGASKFAEQAGVYIVANSDKQALYAGEASNLRHRLQKQFAPKCPLGEKEVNRLTARFFPTSCLFGDRLAYQLRVVKRHRPRFNLPDHR